MKATLAVLTMIVWLLTCGNSPSPNEKDGDPHHHADANSKRAVTAKDDKLGIQLAEVALKLLKIKVTPLGELKAGNNTFLTPHDSLVYFEDKVGIYYQRNGWFNFIEVELKKKTKKNARILAPSLNTSDMLVTRGTPLLRLAHLEAFGASGEGHGH